MSSEERSEHEILLAVAEQALEIQQGAEPVLAAMRSGDGRLAEIAPQAGSAAGRLTELRKELPTAGHPGLQQAADLLDAILNHHTWLLSASMSLVESDLPPEQIERERRQPQGFGPSGTWLATIVDALRSGRLELLDPLPSPSRIPLSE